MKVSDLVGAELDCWVARAEGRKNVKIWNGRCFCDHEHSVGTGFAPTQFWGVGGPIIERERMVLHSPGAYIDEYETNYREAGLWRALAEKPASPPHRGTVDVVEYGPTPLIAAMRAYVASKFGAEVPDEPGSAKP